MGYAKRSPSSALLPASRLRPPNNQPAVRREKPDQYIADALCKALGALEDELGGRKRLIEVLSCAPSSSKALLECLRLLSEPGNGMLGLGRLCAEAGLTTGDLLRHYQGALKLHAQTLAMVHVAKDLPAVTKDVMTRALPMEVDCPDCLGTGTSTPEPSKEDRHPKPGPCPHCKGEGTIIVTPSLERQVVALELGELTPRAQKGASVTAIAVAGSSAQSGPSGFLEQLQQAVSGILAGEAVEGEVVETSPSE